MQIGIDHRRLQLLGKRHRLGHAARHDDAAARHDHRKFGARQQIGGFIKAFLGAGAAQYLLGRENLVIGLAVEIVARNVELRRAALGHRHVETAGEQFGHARMLGDMRLIFGDFREDRQLLGLLETAKADACRFPSPA